MYVHRYGRITRYCNSIIVMSVPMYVSVKRYDWSRGLFIE